MVGGAVRDRRTRRRRGWRRCSAAASRRPAWCRNAMRTGRVVPAVTVSSRSLVSRRLRTDQEYRRTAQAGQREAAVRGALAQGARPECRCAAGSRPGARMFWWSPVTKSSGVDGALGAVGSPQRVRRLERDRQRDHRAGGQGHADVAADGRRVPDLERGQERLAASRRKAGPRVQSPGGAKRIQVADGARGADLEAGVARDEGIPAQRRQVDQAAQLGLLRGEQPRSAGQPGIAFAPVRARPVGRSPDDFGDGVEVHGRTPGRKCRRPRNRPAIDRDQYQPFRVPRWWTR